MNNEDIKGKEIFKEYINKLNDFQTEISFIYYLMKKYNYDFEKHMFRNNILDFMYPFKFEDIIHELLLDTKVSDEERKILNTINKYKDLMYEEHIRTNMDLKKLYDSTEEETIVNCLSEYLNDSTSLYLETVNTQFEIFANYLLKKNDKVTNKMLVFTDSFKLIKHIINNKIKADIIYKEMENDLKESKKLTQLQIFTNILGLSDNIKISKGDILIKTYDIKQKYEFVVVLYLYKYKISPSTIQGKLLDKRKIENLSKKISISNEYFYINEAYKFLKNKGKIISLISNIALYKTADDEIKKEMIDKKLIKSIITIPNFFNTPENKREQNIIILEEESEEIVFKYFDTVEALAGRESCNYYKKINTKDIKTYDLRPDKILLNNEIRYVNAKELNQFLIDCYRGCQTSNLDFDNNGEFELLTVSDIEDEIIGDNLKKFNYEKKNMKRFLRFLIKESDIIISTHGTRIKIAIAENISNRKIIPNTNIIVIRPNANKINPYFLEAYLTTKVGLQSLMDISTGKSNIIINDTNLRNLLISVKDLDKQNTIGKIIKSQRQEIAFLKKRLKEALDEKNSFVEEKVVGEVIDD